MGLLVKLLCVVLFYIEELLPTNVLFLVHFSTCLFVYHRLMNSASVCFLCCVHYGVAGIFSQVLWRGMAVPSRAHSAKPAGTQFSYQTSALDNGAQQILNGLEIRACNKFRYCPDISLKCSNQPNIHLISGKSSLSVIA